MASRLALSLVIGGAVASSLGAAFKTVESGISKLEQKGNKAKVLKNTIGETIKLRDEWKKAHDSGSASAGALLRKLETNLSSLRKQGVEVGRLRQEYQRLGNVAKGADLQIKGRQQIQAGKDGLKSTAAQATAAAAVVAVPTVVSAGYQKIIRDIAIKAGVANQPEEQAMSTRIIQVANDNGMARNDVADLVNQLVGAGMDLNKAMSYADVAAKFSVGQGADGVVVASMIQALEQNAKITDPEIMKKTLEGIALQGQAGSFEAADMAKWFPVLLASMEKTGSTGPEAVAQLGAMLQVQMKTAGSSDEAANNLKNWIEKIGAGDVVKAYKDAGIDYQASLNTGIQKGMSVLESSMALAQQYVEKTDPAKAKKMAEAQAKIDKEVDPKKAVKMLEALEQSLKTGDIFADMQVKAALTAYSQNRKLYEQLKADAQGANGILDKNLAERRETSAQKWVEAKNAVDDAMRSIGDAIRPMTDWVATHITSIAQQFTKLSDGSQGVIAGITAVGGAFLAVKALFEGSKIIRGLFNVGRGSLMGDPNKVQKVFVTNSGDDGEDSDGKNDTKRGKLFSLMELGLKAVGGGDAEGEGDEEEKKGFKPAELGLKVLDIFREASNDDEGGAGDSSEPQKVFVVNADAFRGGPGAGGNDQPGRRRRSRRSRRQRSPGGGPGPGPGPNPPRRGGAPGPNPNPNPRPTPSPRPVPPVPPVPVPPVPQGSGRLGQVVRAARAATEVGKRVPGLNLLDAGLGAIDVAMNAETQDEKAEGYGGVAGGLAGGMAGAAMGAAVGSVVPVIGTAVGALIGGLLGSTGGELGGTWLGKALFGEKEPADEGKTAVMPEPVAVPPVAAPAPLPVSYDPRDPGSKDAFLLPAFTENRVGFPGAPLTKPGAVVQDLAKSAGAAPSASELAKSAAPKVDARKVEQLFSFAPNMPVTVQGDAKDPERMAQEMFPHMKRMWEDYSRQAQSRQLSDEAHI